jgi:hypothetical protein
VLEKDRGNGGETKSRPLTPEEVAEFGAPAGAPNA